MCDTGLRLPLCSPNPRPHTGSRPSHLDALKGGSRPGLLWHFRSHSGKVRSAARTQKPRTQSTAQGNELGTEASRTRSLSGTPGTTSAASALATWTSASLPHVTAAIASKRVPRRPRLTFQAGVQASVSNHQSSEQWPEWGIWVQPWARCDSLPQTCPCWGTCDHLLCPWKLSPEGQEEAAAAMATHPLVLYCVLSAVT